MLFEVILAGGVKFTNEVKQNNKNNSKRTLWRYKIHSQCSLVKEVLLRQNNEKLFCALRDQWVGLIFTECEQHRPNCLVFDLVGVLASNDWKDPKFLFPYTVSYAIKRVFQDLGVIIFQD